MSGSVKLTLDVSGSVGKATIGPFTAIYELVNETAGTGPFELKVPPTADPGDVEAVLPPMAEQKLLLVLSDEDVIYELNDDGVQRVLTGGGFVILPGDPVISKLTFGNIGKIRTATITLIQIGDEGPTPPTSLVDFLLNNLGPAVAGQTVFNLTRIPNKPSSLMLFIEGIEYSEQTGFFTLVSSVLTWLPAAAGSFALQDGMRVEAYYR